MYSGIGARLSADWYPIWLYVGTLPAGDNPTKQWRPESLQSVLPSMITESRLWPSGDKIHIKTFYSNNWLPILFKPLFKTGNIFSAAISGLNLMTKDYNGLSLFNKRFSSTKLKLLQKEKGKFKFKVIQNRSFNLPSLGNTSYLYFEIIWINM